METGLNVKQEKFVLEYLKNGGNGTEAAITAGYSPKSAHVQASTLLKNPKVLAYKRQMSEQVYKELGLSPAQIGLDLYSIVKRCMAATPHLSWDSDEHAYVPDGTWQFDAKGATRALELLGKMVGAFQDRVEITGGVEDYLKTMAEQGKEQTF